MVGVFDLEGQLGFYAQYHNNPLNVVCHVIGVPSIVWSLYVWLASAGDLANVAGYNVNISTLGACTARPARVFSSQFNVTLTLIVFFGLRFPVLCLLATF